MDKDLFRSSHFVPVLEPQWLSKDTNHQFTTGTKIQPLTDKEDCDISNSNSGYYGRENDSRTNKSPRILGRSKSQPLLENEGYKRSDVFLMLKERSTFDRNFPNLNKKSKPNIVGSPKDKETVWKQPVSESVVGRIITSVNKPNVTIKSVSNLNNGNSISDEEMKPSVHNIFSPTSSVVSNLLSLPPKFVSSKSKVELVIPNVTKKKDKKPNNFDVSILRKATSEPSLPIRGEYTERYAKLMALKKAREEKAKKEAEEKIKTSSQLDDNYSSQDTFQKEEYKGKQDQQEDPTSNLLSLSLNPSQNIEISIPVGTNLKKNENLDVNNTTEKNLLFSREEEEKFLRNLGWVPEEEESIPELTIEEIVQVKNLIKDINSETKDKIKVSFDLSIKKWQYDKYQRSVQTVL